MIKRRRIPVLLCIGATAFLLAGTVPFCPDASVSAQHLEDVYELLATDITAECVLEVSENMAERTNLSDPSVLTDWHASGDASIDITAPERIGALYIEWTSLPAGWTLSVWRKDAFVPYRDYGTDNFINEFVPIDGSFTKIRIQWAKTEKPVAIGRLTVYTKGTVPDTVQKWAPPCERADLLLLSTHADDEHLYFGGTLPTYAAEQHKEVQVAYLVNHGIPRTRELLAGLWVVGVTNYPVLSDFPDRYVGSYEEAAGLYGYENVLGYQVMLIRRFQPSVVIGHDLMGEYGHGAHMLNAKALTEAVLAASDPLRFPDTAEKYGTWGTSKLYLHLYEKNTIIMDWTVPLKTFDGKTAWEMAKEGYDQHVSQHPFKFRVRIEGPNDCRLFGLYYTTVGLDVLKNDFFENIPSIDPGSSSDTSSDSLSESSANSSDTEVSKELSDPGAAEPDRPFDAAQTLGIVAGGAAFIALLSYLLFTRRKRAGK